MKNQLQSCPPLSRLVGKSRREEVPELSQKSEREYIKARIQGTDRLLREEEKRTGKGTEREYKYMIEGSSNKEVPFT